ncbi:MAG TPA: TetR/AcrR family transcriptional regulator [Solirubrobacterales bacterium]|nr:TetR/AcrR family transcriptional regulator [Solirubrobacterales bacterium]
MPPALTRESVDRGQLSRKVRGEERRARALERLVDVFAKRGYQAATVDHLIAGGQISMGSFYKDFEGKEDCFVAVYDLVEAEARERIAAAVPAQADWAATATCGVRAAVEYAAGRPMAARLVLLEAQTGGERALGRYDATLKALAAFLREGRSQAGAAEDLPASFEDATVSGLAWLLQSRLAAGRIEDPGELWPLMARMVLEPYLGATGAEKAIRAHS